MAKYTCTELIPLKVRQEEQSLETVEISLLEQPKSGLDIEIECPRCNDIMELNSKFDSLVYFCDTCSFGLKCV
jgi:phage FluMu protein Com